MIFLCLTLICTLVLFVFIFTFMFVVIVSWFCFFPIRHIPLVWSHVDLTFIPCHLFFLFFLNFFRHSSITVLYFILSFFQSVFFSQMSHCFHSFVLSVFPPSMHTYRHTYCMINFFHVQIHVHLHLQMHLDSQLHFHVQIHVQIHIHYTSYIYMLHIHSLFM